MSRVKISENGPEIAKSGYDVDTASDGDMIFRPGLSPLRIALKGLLTPTTFSGGASTLSDYYKRSIVNFSEPFSSPPIVMIAGQTDNGVDQRQFYGKTINGSHGWMIIVPECQILSYTDRFELYVHIIAGIPANWRYWVLNNVLTA